MERIAVVAAGGGAPGIGAFAGAAAKAAAEAGAEIVAVPGGFGGLLAGASVPLPAGGEFDLAPAPWPDLRKPGSAAAVAAKAREAGITAVVVAGGEGSAAGAAALAAAGLPSLFVPATVHDDVRGTDACLGVDGYVNAILRRVAAEAASGAPLLVEVPGALTGHVALLAAVGCGARGAILVERPFPWDRWREVAARGPGAPVLFRAEGGGSRAEAEARLAAAWPKVPPRTIPAAEFPRSGAPSLFDRLLALRFGEAAMAALLGGVADRMIAFRGGLCLPAPLAEVAGRRRQVPPELFEIAKSSGVLFE